MSFRILFMGTPDFALFSLRALCESGYNVIGVVTQPDKPRGRGYVLTPPPVKVYAEQQNIPVYQPNTLKGEEFADTLSELDPDVIVVAAYGKILPENVINYPRCGCINVHGSLLPEYRGAAPMQRAIIDGKSVTGVTIMYMDVGLDTGDMLLKKEFPIGENANFEDVHDGLGKLGATALLEALDSIKCGCAKRTAQDCDCASYAKKIEKCDCMIDFTRSAQELHNLIRGLSPFPLATTHTPDGKLLKIVSARLCNACNEVGAAGQVVSLDGGIKVLCGDGNAVIITGVLPEGKGRMSAEAFINGRRIKLGDILS